MPPKRRLSAVYAHPASEDSYVPSSDPLAHGYSSDAPMSDCTSAPLPKAPGESSRAELSLLDKVRRVFKTMDRVGLSLATFLHAVFYGDPECTSNFGLAQRRRHFYETKLLPTVLSNMCRPKHRAATHHKRNFKGPSQFLRKFAISTATDEILGELRRYEAQLPSGPQPVTKENLLDTTMEGILGGFEAHAPKLVRLVQDLTVGKNTKRRTLSTHDTHARNMIAVIGSMLVFSRSNRQNQLQRKLAIYLKAKGTPVSVFDFLQSIGLTLSYRWAHDAVDTLAETEMAELRVWVANEPFAVDINNVLLSYGVASQRVLNRSQTVNATACTVLKLPHRALAALRSYGEILRSLRERVSFARRHDPSSVPRLTASDLIDPVAHQRFAHHHIHHILRVLLDCPPFSDFERGGRPVFGPPEPVHQLPTGPEHHTQYFMLKTEPFDETSYDGILRCIAAFMNQMGLDTPEAQVQYGVERGIPWGGDGLTTARMRALQRFRVDAMNGWDRFDWFFTFRCLFHQLWWILIDIHHNHYGTDVGDGLCREITSLGRKGMAYSNKKPDFHTLDEMVTQFWTASTLDCWLWVSDSDSRLELRTWADSQTDSDLCAAARKIYLQRQSTAALVQLDARHRANNANHDDSLYHRILANRDMGFYVTLRRAVKQGDIGIYRNTLPDLLVFYKGGGNTNYVRETAEMMQFLLKDMPPEISDVVFDHCLLVNITGKPNRFIPTGQLQEHNNNKIKNNHSTHSAGSSMELTRRVSPALPVLDSVCKHVDSAYTDLYHGVSHTSPNADVDIAKMVARFHSAGIHTFTRGRTVERPRDKPVDQMRKGTHDLITGTWLEEWWESREVFLRYARTSQDFLDPPQTS